MISCLGLDPNPHPVTGSPGVYSQSLGPNEEPAGSHWRGWLPTTAPALAPSDLGRVSAAQRSAAQRELKRRAPAGTGGNRAPRRESVAPLALPPRSVSISLSRSTKGGARVGEFCPAEDPPECAAWRLTAASSRSVMRLTASPGKLMTTGLLPCPSLGAAQVQGSGRSGRRRRRAGAGTLMAAEARWARVSASSLLLCSWVLRVAPSSAEYSRLQPDRRRGPLWCAGRGKGVES